MYKLKIYRGDMCHDNEEWYINWIGTGLSFLNWHEELHKFGPEHSKQFVLIGSLWPKYIMFELQSTEKLSFMILKSWTNFEENSSCDLKNVEKLGNLSPEHL